MRERGSKKVLEFLKNLPEGRKIYYRFGNLMVEVTKEEAKKLLYLEGEGVSSPETFKKEEEK